MGAPVHPNMHINHTQLSYSNALIETCYAYDIMLHINVRHSLGSKIVSKVQLVVSNIIEIGFECLTVVLTLDLGLESSVPTLNLSFYLSHDLEFGYMYLLVHRIAY